MSKLKAVGLTITTLMVFLGCSAGNDRDTSDYSVGEAETPELETTTADISELRDAGFSQHALVFGIPIVGTEEVDVETMTHAKTILAEYLDNDEDAIADNPEVIRALQDSKAVAAIFSTFDEYENFDDRGGYEEAKNFELITMTQEETNPQYGFDASLEEILHLVTSLGFASAFPSELGETGGSDLLEALDEAEELGFFSYDDPTCDRECRATEFIYWSITSMMGLQEDRCEEIRNEWSLCSKQLMINSQLQILEIINNPELGIPTVAPDGIYVPFL